jgi:methylated-DNA-[protein]-cysteine S-methyltransferase
MPNTLISLSTPFWVDGLERTPIGPVSAAVTEMGLARLNFCSPQMLKQELNAHPVFDGQTRGGMLENVLDQIQAYFNKARESFDFPLDWRVFTEFQQQVLKATLAIPFGQVRTYQQLAAQIGKPQAARAVGNAEAHNLIPLVIPCHRVVNSTGGLHGYSAPGGLDTKAWLLRMEGHQVTNNQLQEI